MSVTYHVAYLVSFSSIGFLNKISEKHNSASPRATSMQNGGKTILTETQTQENPAYKMTVYTITLCTLYALTCSV